MGGISSVQQISRTMTSTSYYSSASSSSISDSEGEKCNVEGYEVPHSILSEVLGRVGEEELIVKSLKGPQIIALVNAPRAQLASRVVSGFNDSVVAKLQANLRMGKWGWPNFGEDFMS